MKNNEIKNRQHMEKHLKKIRDMYIEIIQALFIGKKHGKQRCIYNRKVEKVGRRKFLEKSHNFVHGALNQLKAN